MNSLFENSTLFISARSPFARRVRIALHENGVGFTERVFDVFQPQPVLWKANPLARVPSLILASGQVLIDSNLILQAFYETCESPFMPREQSKRLEIFHGSAIAVGICEKLVEYYLETLRPEHSRDRELFAEIEGCLIRSLDALELRVSRSDQLTQADFDIGTALAYLTLRHPLDWRPRYPRLAELLERLNARSSFQKTVPPPA